MAEHPNPAHGFLARRFNFLGLPSERRGGAISYPELRAELGDDNAAALVTKVGELVKARGLDKLGVPEQLAVDRVVQSLSPDERRTMAEGGIVPRAEALISAEVSQAEVQRKLTRDKTDDVKAAAHGQYAALGLFGGRSGGLASGSEDGGATSGSREMFSYARQQEENVRSAMAVAEKYGLEWVKGNRELLQLGPAAIQALADVHLREDSYKRLKNDVGLDNPTIVNGARYFKKNGGDYNRFSEEAAETNKGLTPQERAVHREAISGVFRPNQTPQQEQEAKQKFNEATEKFVKSHPHLREHIERERDLLHTQKKLEVKSEVKADAKVATADAKVATVDEASAKMAEMLKKRREAAAAGPKAGA